VSAGGQDDEPTYRLGPWRELAASVWVAVAEPDAVNLVLVAGRERALLVDTGSSPEQGAAVRAAAAEVSSAPLEVVVVTHAHRDHVFGLAAFDDLVTVGHEDVAGALVGPVARSDAARLGVDPARLVAPNHPIALAAAYDLGGRRVEVAHVGRGHTGGDLVVVVPDADLVVVGDLVESAAPPSLGPDSFLHEWPVTLDGVIGLMTAGTRAVPGHGDPVDRPYVYEQRGRLAAIAGEVRHLAESGVDPGEALRSGSWAYPVETLAAGLPVAFGQLDLPVRRRTLPMV
jgi:glyoxylase-like metal-dependent hydrolase (beta-lactamase superfamily II)